MSAELNCRDLVERVTDLLEDALDEGLSRRCAEHLADCPGCRAYVDQMQQTIRTVARSLRAGASEDERAALLALFRAHGRGETS